MNAEMILVRSNAADVRETVRSMAASLPSERVQPLSLPAFPSRPDIRKGVKRTLILVDDEPWTAILEGGAVADEFLARALSRQLETQAIIVGQYDTTNAWARRTYARGRVIGELFTPSGAFEVGHGDEEWDGDAGRESSDWLKREGWRHGVITFGPLIERGQLPGISADRISKIVLDEAHA